MSQELVAQIVNPVSGELVNRAHLWEVADAIDQVRTYKRRLDDAISEMTEVLSEYSAKIGAKTFEVEGYTVVVSPDKELVWDIDYLDQALGEAGLPEDRIRQLITSVVQYKVNAAVANQIAASNPEYAAIIERAKSYQPKRQYVTLKPGGSRG